MWVFINRVMTKKRIARNPIVFYELKSLPDLFVYLEPVSAEQT